MSPAFLLVLLLFHTAITPAISATISEAPAVINAASLIDVQSVLLIGVPNGIRTRVTAVKGRCPNRWTMGTTGCLAIPGGKRTSEANAVVLRRADGIRSTSLRTGSEAVP